MMTRDDEGVMSCNRECDGDIVALNAACRCLGIDPIAMSRKIGREASEKIASLLDERPNLFASTAVFISTAQLHAMEEQAEAIEAVAASDAFRREVTERATIPVAPYETPGLFLGYDFHLSADGPKLIEVNTNAGGAFLVEKLEAAVRLSEPSCGDGAFGSIGPAGQSIARTIIREYGSARPGERPTCVAIVDERPQDQFLHPDMLLAAEALKTLGINSIVCDPSDLTVEAGALRARGEVVDLVYNRLCDFDLSEERHSVLRHALTEGLAVVSPAPIHHAVYADKRNLVLWTDRGWRESASLGNEKRAGLEHIPKALLVDDADADLMWANRKHYFFKPFAGYGSRAVYRGDKLTKKVWATIREGGYIAQERVDPPVRAVPSEDPEAALKFDLRLFRYAGRTELLAARIYQGQTTNLRTPGGGLGAVFVVPS
jgi:hypothetical protein